METRICSRCVMDTTDPEIEFDEKGVCNHCTRHDYLAKYYDKSSLPAAIEKIKEEGKEQKYDCLVGLSGGVDSCYVLHLAKEWGLRPLAFTFDNGWDTPQAANNVKAMVDKLGVPHIVKQIDLNTFHKAQVAMLKSSTPDVELITDHILSDLLYETAIKNDVGWVLSGSNYQSESHLAWSYDWSDWLYIKTLLKQNGFDGDYEKLPHYGKLEQKRLKASAKIFSPLQYMDYDKEKVKKMLIEQYGWMDYGGKHYESTWTKFFQVFYLPTKFGYDKRKCHLSALICSGQLTREEALEKLKEPLETFDLTPILATLGISKADWDYIMTKEKKSYHDYMNWGKFSNYYARKRYKGLK
jgi:N-acetyl sugar amidotransferase